MVPSSGRVWKTRQDRIECEHYERVWEDAADGAAYSGSVGDHFTLDRPNPALPKVMELVAPGPSSLRILDVGSGNGRNAKWLCDRGHEVVAIDISRAAIRLSRERTEGACKRGGSVKVRLMSVLEDCAQLGDFDVVYDDGCFHHMRFSVWRRYSRNVYALMKRGGYFVLLGYDRRSRGIKGYRGPADPRPWRLERNHFTRFLDRGLVIGFFGSRLDPVCTWAVPRGSGAVFRCYVFRRQP